MRVMAAPGFRSTSPLFLLSLLMTTTSNAFRQNSVNFRTTTLSVKSSTASFGESATARPPLVADSTPDAATELPPILRNMIDERREFEMNLGKAMDVLRRDYPSMLTRSPDFSIYHDQIKVVDPSGVQLTGLKNYRSSFRFLQSIIGLFYNTEKSSVQLRMVYDFARCSIRLSFNVMLVPKIVGNRRNALYIDGISVYKMNAKSGTIVEHRVENLLMNNIPVHPPYGVLTELLQPVSQPVPAGIGAMIVP